MQARMPLSRVVHEGGSERLSQATATPTKPPTSAKQMVAERSRLSSMRAAYAPADAFAFRARRGYRMTAAHAICAMSERRS
jgi:hypothetical protein